MGCGKRATWGVGRCAGSAAPARAFKRFTPDIATRHGAMWGVGMGKIHTHMHARRIVTLAPGEHVPLLMPPVGSTQSARPSPSPPHGCCSSRLFCGHKYTYTKAAAAAHKPPLFVIICTHRKRQQVRGTTVYVQTYGRICCWWYKRTAIRRACTMDASPCQGDSARAGETSGDRALPCDANGRV